MVTYAMVKNAVDGLSANLQDQNTNSSRKCPNLKAILQTISMVLALLQQITQQVQELEKFKESYENQKRFTEKNC